MYGKYVFGDWSTSFVRADGKLYYLEETEPGIWERYEFRIHIWPLGTGINILILSITKINILVNRNNKIILLGELQRVQTGCRCYYFQPKELLHYFCLMILLSCSIAAAVLCFCTSKLFLNHVRISS